MRVSLALSLAVITEALRRHEPDALVLLEPEELTQLAADWAIQATFEKHLKPEAQELISFFVEPALDA